jgi:hypothetical protein
MNQSNLEHLELSELLHPEQVGEPLVPRLCRECPSQGWNAETVVHQSSQPPALARLAQLDSAQLRVDSR